MTSREMSSAGKRRSNEESGVKGMMVDEWCGEMIVSVNDDDGDDEQS